jgi:hypothetical protein
VFPLVVLGVLYDFSRALHVDRRPLGTDGRVLGDDRQDLDRGGPGRIVLVLLR